MSTVTLIGIDIGKHNFHLHAQDKSGKEILRKKVLTTADDGILSQSSNLYGGNGGLRRRALPGSRAQGHGP
jgi:predicted NBD/HSP70 family sugar kinase